MTLAAGDRVLFYSSANLKTWIKEGEFGAGIGAHGGVWECPDLLSFTVDGKKIWLLIVSINPGSFQGGSGTQYSCAILMENNLCPRTPVPAGSIMVQMITPELHSVIPGMPKYL